jgi:hypothetical protein
MSCAVNRTRETIAPSSGECMVIDPFVHRSSNKPDSMQGINTGIAESSDPRDSLIRTNPLAFRDNLHRFDRYHYRTSTVARIGAALGGGSPNDVTPALKAWKESVAVAAGCVAFLAPGSDRRFGTMSFGGRFRRLQTATGQRQSPRFASPRRRRQPRE